jgi:Na+/proline symporter
MLAVMVAGLALVMSSADTIINAVASIIVVDLGRAVPAMQGPRLLAIARVAILVAAVPIVFAAAQGYSVLYLFLLADLICSALAFPVFFGLYSARYDAVAAAASIVAGLVAGGLLFPDPSLSSGSLIGAFALAFVVPIAVSALFLMVRRRTGFDFALLRTAVRPISG